MSKREGAKSVKFVDSLARHSYNCLDSFVLLAARLHKTKYAGGHNSGTIRRSQNKKQKFLQGCEEV